MRTSRLPATAFVMVLAANAVGVWLLLAAWQLFTESARFVERANPVPGKIVAYDRPGHTSVGPLQPVVRFNVSRAETHEFRPGFATLWSGYDIGDSVVVLYDPENPDDARVDDFWQLWFVAVGAAVFGGALILVPLAASAWALLGARSARL